MCLAIPAQVIKKLENNLVIADFGRGVRREVSVSLIQEPLTEGDWILIHTGYAVSKMEPEDARETLALWEEIWTNEEQSI